MTAARLDLKMVRGVALSRRLIWVDSNREPIDLTPYTARMVIKDSNSGLSLFLSTENGGITLDADGGVMLRASVKTMTDIQFSSGIYDIELEDSDGIVTRLAQGNISILPYDTVLQPFDIAATIISQYANSPTLTQLIANMGDYIDPAADLNAFYEYVWDVETAQGFGLDIWGRIVGIGRDLNIPGEATYLGFQEAFTTITAATGAQPFGQAPFYSGPLPTTTYTLADDAYRRLILVKALGNISDCTIPSLNQLLQNLFAGRGRCYVTDTGAMEMRFVFEFDLLPYEIAILTNSGAVPRPAAVYARVLQVALPTTFGFNEGSGQPFGSGVFFTPSGLIDAS